MASSTRIGGHSRVHSLAIGEDSVREVLDLLEWKRHVFALYGAVRDEPDPRTAWDRWRRVRAGLFRDHPQSPRLGFDALDYFAYNPSCAYDPKWACPLSPPANRLPVAVRAGEKEPEVGLEPTTL